MNLLILADMDDFHWPYGGGRAVGRAVVTVISRQKCQEWDTVL